MPKKVEELEHPEQFYRDADLPAYYQSLIDDLPADDDKNRDRLTERLRAAKRAARATDQAVADHEEESKAELAKAKKDTK